MLSFFLTTWKIIHDPPAFFEQARVEGWWIPYRYFLVIAVTLAVLSPLAWALGVDGSSPINTSMTAQRDTYRLWQATLQPMFGNWSYLLGGVTLFLTTHLILIIFSPILLGVFRLLGGRGSLLHAWKSICYGLAPTLVLGCLPFLGLLTGLYATLLQLAIGPGTLYGIRDGRAYVLVVFVLSITIVFFGRVSLYDLTMKICMSLKNPGEKSPNQRLYHKYFLAHSGFVNVIINQHFFVRWQIRRRKRAG